VFQQIVMNGYVRLLHRCRYMWFCNVCGTLYTALWE